MTDSPHLRHALKSALRVMPTRVYRIYQGGKLLDQYRGIDPARDGEFPEDWVGSDTGALNPGREHLPEGLSNVEMPDGQQVRLKDLIQQFPADMLGEPHVARWGNSTALLVKLLDAAVRLPVHCHPDRAFARQHMNSPHGKTECWIIREVRVIDGVEPYLALGFQDGVTREDFAEWVQKQDSTAMLNALHRVAVRPGDVYFVAAGVAHAIGEGVFMIEVQEPSDWYVMAEYASFGMREEDAHQGRGWELGLGSFDYRTFSSVEDMQAAYKQQTPIIRQVGSSYERQLIASQHAEFFGASQLVVNGSLPMPGGTFCVGITDGGSGQVVTEGGTLPIQRGTTFVVPAGTGEYELRADADTELQVTVCFPPRS